jgi:hypothetical protein
LSVIAISFVHGSLNCEKMQAAARKSIDPGARPFASYGAGPGLQWRRLPEDRRASAAIVWR